MKNLKILVGNIGSGKSGYCKKLAEKNNVIISADDVRYSLGAGKYTFNPKYERAIYISLRKLCELLMLDSEANVIIDETNMTKQQRKLYLKLADIFDYNKIAVIFPKLSKEESIKKRLGANHGDTPKEVWEEVWEKKNKEYEEPTLEEGFDRIELYEERNIK